MTPFSQIFVRMLAQVHKLKLCIGLSVWKVLVILVVPTPPPPPTHNTHSGGGGVLEIKLTT